MREHDSKETKAVTQINKCNVILKKMYHPGTDNIINGIRLKFKYIVSIPNIPRNPYMIFYSHKTSTKGNLRGNIRIICDSYWAEISRI